MNQKIILLALASLLLFSCSQSGFKNENGVKFTADKLTGHYKMNMMPLINETINEEDNAGKRLGLALLSMSGLSVDLYFNSNGNGKIKTSAGIFDAFIKKDLPDIDFTYRLEDDSILIIKSPQNEGRLTIRKFTDTFDFIELIDKNDNKKVELEKVSD